MTPEDNKPLGPLFASEMIDAVNEIRRGYNVRHG